MNGQAAALVVDIVPNNLNLNGRKARNKRYADDEVTIQFYSGSVRQLRTVERGATAGTEEELQRIIKVQRDRVNPYPYISDEFKLAD